MRHEANPTTCETHPCLTCYMQCNGMRSHAILKSIALFAITFVWLRLKFAKVTFNFNHSI